MYSLIKKMEKTDELEKRIKELSLELKTSRKQLSDIITNCEHDVIVCTENQTLLEGVHKLNFKCLICDSEFDFRTHDPEKFFNRELSTCYIIDVSNYKEGIGLSLEGKFDIAKRVFTKILEENPGISLEDAFEKTEKLIKEDNREFIEFNKKVREARECN